MNWLFILGVLAVILVPIWYIFYVIVDEVLTCLIDDDYDDDDSDN